METKTCSGPFFNIWMEADGGWGCSEVASCILAWVDIMNVSQGHLVCWSYSCAGQNKNYYIICLWQYLLKTRNFVCIDHKISSFRPLLSGFWPRLWPCGETDQTERQHIFGWQISGLVGKITTESYACCEWHKWLESSIRWRTFLSRCSLWTELTILQWFDQVQGCCQMDSSELENASTSTLFAMTKSGKPRTYCPQQVILVTAKFVSCRSVLDTLQPPGWWKRVPEITATGCYC